MTKTETSGEHASLVQLNIERHVALVTLNRPQARNAVNAELAQELERVTERIERDDDVRVAILTGAGPVFCAGADLRQVAAGELDKLFTPAGGFAGFVNARRRKPWIAAVNGVALAGGFEIVLACDLAVATSEARFGLPEVTRGLIASAGGLYRLPRALPKAVAMELILTGGKIDAPRALALGLLNAVVDTDEPLTAARILADTICANAPLAVRESVAIARAAAGFDDPDLRARADEAQVRLSTTADYAEGARAFLEKRAPEWLGR